MTIELRKNSLSSILRTFRKTKTMYDISSNDFSLKNKRKNKIVFSMFSSSFALFAKFSSSNSAMFSFVIFASLFVMIFVSSVAMSFVVTFTSSSMRDYRNKQYNDFKIKTTINMKQWKSIWFKLIVFSLIILCFVWFFLRWNCFETFFSSLLCVFVLRRLTICELCVCVLNWRVRHVIIIS